MKGLICYEILCENVLKSAIVVSDIVYDCLDLKSLGFVEIVREIG